MHYALLSYDVPNPWEGLSEEERQATMRRFLGRRLAER